eukprot:3459940-Amphidinium_carterae.1
MLWEASQALESFSDIASSLLQPERLVVAALLAWSVCQDSAPVCMPQQGSQLRGAELDQGPAIRKGLWCPRLQDCILVCLLI